MKKLVTIIVVYHIGHNSIIKNAKEHWLWLTNTRKKKSLLEKYLIFKTFHMKRNSEYVISKSCRNIKRNSSKVFQKHNNFSWKSLWILRASFLGVIFMWLRQRHALFFKHNNINLYLQYIVLLRYNIFMVYRSWVTKWASIGQKVFTELSSVSELDRANYRHMGVCIINNIAWHEYTISNFKTHEHCLNGTKWVKQNVEFYQNNNNFMTRIKNANVHERSSGEKWIEK